MSQATNTIPFSRPTTPTPPGLQIGFVGLGSMGYFIARNLAKGRPADAAPLLVYNRTASKAEKLVQEVGAGSAKVAASLEQLVNACDVVVTNLANDAVVELYYGEFAKALKAVPPTKPKIFVEASTVYPTVISTIDKVITSFPNCHLVGSPVFGRPPVADAAKLIVVLSGDYHSRKQIAHLLVPAMGRMVMDLGDDVTKAHTLKLIGNSMILGMMELVGEVFTLGQKSGVGQKPVLDLIKGLMPAPPLVRYAEIMASDSLDGSDGFSMDGGIKDANHMRRLANDLNAPAPMIDIAHQHMLTTRALHEAQKAAGTSKYDVVDWSALIAGSRAAAGLDPFDSGDYRVDLEN